MPTSTSSPTRKAAILIFVGIAAFAVLLDQATKLFVENTLTLGESIPVIPGFLSWQYHLNPGAAFSIGTDHTWIFTIIQSTVLVIALFASRRLGGSWLWTLGLAGLAGGVAGNLIDRLFREPSFVQGTITDFAQGHVVDFIAVSGFAIFNIADSFIVVSIILLCLLMLRGVEMDGTRAGTKNTSAEEEPS